ncbi:MAG: ASKHA domain-containing protein [Sedimentibacter sp.]
MKKYTVNFINQNISVAAQEGTQLAKICEEAGFALDLVCNGKGTCGKCKIEIESNNVKSHVLSCETLLSSDLNVYLNKNDYKKSARILETIAEVYSFNPSLKKIYKDKKTISNEKNAEFLRNCHIDVLRKFSELINHHNCEGITFVVFEDEIIDVEMNDTSNSLHGAAVDIGTTTVVLYVYDMTDGKLINTYSDLNSQISFGADVISRINYADSQEKLEKLNGKIIHTLNKLVQRAEIEIPNLKETLYNITLCGNSTMQHLFFGFRPDSLGISPYLSITKDYVECFGKDTNLNCKGRCKIIFLPLLGGFVGADTTAVLLSLDDDKKENLIIDLGTNGEIAAGNINKYYVASTACGPALEGENIECGMRGTEGAIEKVKIENNNVLINVIGNVEPLGMCGSGIIDIVAELLRNNIIDSTGRLLSYDEYKQMRPYSKLCDRLYEINGNNCFILYESNNKKIYVNQNDIRQIQLAKSSIYSGCMALLNACGKSLDGLNKIIVAGAFGNYIDVNNAVFIGLLPDALDKIEFIGNGAGKGISMFLLHHDMKDKCDRITSNTTHYELAEDEFFTFSYINNINFKN